MEELEESVWSVVRQENEHEDQGKVYRTVVKPACHRTSTPHKRGPTVKKVTHVCEHFKIDRPT